MTDTLIENPSDFYNLEQLLTDSQRDTLEKVRIFMQERVQPIINEHWTKEEFPHHLLPEFAKLGVVGAPYQGYGCPGEGWLFEGFLSQEISKIDCSIGTFFGVQNGLAMGSIYLCGSEEQKEYWLPKMRALEVIGAFGLTEPEHGSDISKGLATTAERRGDKWVLNGQKKWIGNATFADITVIWARDKADGQVKGFLVEKGTEGFQTKKMQHKMALRVVQNAEITGVGQSRFKIDQPGRFAERHLGSGRILGHVDPFFEVRLGEHAVGMDFERVERASQSDRAHRVIGAGS